MAIGRTNAGSGGGLNKSILIVSAPTGATLTATLEDTVKTAAEKTPGEYWLRNLDVGEWTLKLTQLDQTATTTYNIEEFGVYRTSMAFFLSAADFVWGGTKGTDYEIVQDDDTVIPEGDYQKYENWKARILTSTAITPKSDIYVDVFLVGGGGGPGEWSGGGGGYTKTSKKLKLTNGTKYQITIGAGGAKGTAGGKTTAFDLTANGGDHGDGDNGGDGGSGGGRTDGGLGGSDGNDARGGSSNKRNGKGQGTTTREFGESGAKLYAGGGNGNGTSGKPGAPGGGGKENESGKTNTGGGSGCYESNSRVKGGSGIVVIRNAREVA